MGPINNNNINIDANNNNNVPTGNPTTATQDKTQKVINQMESFSSNDRLDKMRFMSNVYSNAIQLNTEESDKLNQVSNEWDNEAKKSTSVLYAHLGVLPGVLPPSWQKNNKQ